MLTQQSVNQEKPSVYIVHGDDQQAIAHKLEDLTKKVGKPELAALNVVRLDGRSLKREEFANNIHLLPFSVGRRLVILTHALAGINNQAQQESFLKLLESVPPTTALVLVILDSQRIIKGTLDWEVLNQKHWLRMWMKAQDARVHETACSKPAMRVMPSWIHEQAKEQGGIFNRAAAAELANLIGNDTLLASQEIIKLLTYVNNERAVTLQDVRALSSQVPRENIFGMVDAMALGDGKTAVRLLKTLLENQRPTSIFAMIVRQFRLLMLTKEVIQEGGGSEQVTREVRVMPFLAKKLIRQARRFTIEQLEDIYQQLYELDGSMKSGRMPPDLAMEIFVVELAA
jgi:DNA polymerase-3 subunit delta